MVMVMMVMTMIQIMTRMMMVMMMMASLMATMRTMKLCGGQGHGWEDCEGMLRIRKEDPPPQGAWE